MRIGGSVGVDGRPSSACSAADRGAKVMTLKRKYALAAILACSACGAGATSKPSVHPAGPNFPSAYALPGERLFPESIAYDPQTKDFYVGGLLDGAIVRGNAGTSAGARIVSPPGADGRASVAGIKIDRQKRLWVAGGEAGKLFVYELGSLKPLASFAVGKGEKRVVNDIAITDDGEAYVTDSAYPALYHVTMGEQPKLEEWPVDSAAVPYSGAYNLNGIVVTSDQKTLLMVQTSTGKLFRFDRATRSFSAVDLGGASVLAGDGLAISGQNLFVACNATRSVAKVSLSSDFRSGKVLSNAANTRFGFPTAIAVDGDALLVVNAQLDSLAPGKSPSLPFTVTRVAITDLQ
jgi:sugar lactone lactonase YvrE